MTKKKRRHMRLTLTLSVLIASVPLSLAFLFNEGDELKISTNFFSKEKTATEVPHTGKVLPMLANK